jgi:dephospho-CoA kinase
VKKIIIITGLPGAGKTLVSGILQELGLPAYKFSDALRKEIKRMGLEDTVRNEELVAEELREKYGQDVLAQRAADEIKDFRGDTIILDGARSIEEIQFLNDFGEVIILLVEADEKTRFARIRKRNSERDAKNIEDFKWREERNLRVLGLDKILATTDYPKYTIPNNGSIEDLKKRVRSFCKKFMPGKLQNGKE